MNDSTIRLAMLGAFTSMLLASGAASAEPRSGRPLTEASAHPPATGAIVVVLPVVTVYGRPNRPQVVIEVVRPTAASMAASTHEELHREWLERLTPARLREAGGAK